MSKKSALSLPDLVFVARPHYNAEELNVSEKESELIDSCQENPGDIVLVGTYQLVGTEKRTLSVRSSVS